VKLKKMSSREQVSAACCSIPPIVAKDYQHKGSYQMVNGLKTYVTGPADATHGILMITDVFGFFPQTLQGADILAYANHEKPYRVFMPDWFDGEPMPIAWYPPDTDDKKQKLGHFFQTKAAPPATVAKIPGVTKALQEEAPAVQSWGILGLCWGAKVGSLFSFGLGLLPYDHSYLLAISAKETC
jgi:dienelactone hydrolase